MAGAPVLAFSREHIAAGEACRAVIVAIYPGQLPLRAAVTDGTDQPMYEGTVVLSDRQDLRREDFLQDRIRVLGLVRQDRTNGELLLALHSDSVAPDALCLSLQ
jgi:hypothetical protein